MTTSETPPPPDYGEPWDASSEYVYNGCGKQVHLYTERSRVAACVNACAGMADPAAEIAAMREALLSARDALTEAFERSHPDKQDGQSLFHVHHKAKKALRNIKPFLP